MTVAVAQLSPKSPLLSEAVHRVTLRCTRCAANMGRLNGGYEISICPACNWKMICKDGIWRALQPDRASYFSRFVNEYESIRAAEGRGSNHADYYLQLPYRDTSHRNQAQWSIRARTFRYIEKHILPALFSDPTAKLCVLDLGAGNGWMSYRLALQGHFPAAIDLLTNPRDGLGAAFHYCEHLPVMFPRVQAELDNLPFSNNQFDLAIFNASFHYSEDYERTLAEAMRCVRTGGAVIIADTAWYSREESGQAMLEERKAAFAAKYGTASDAVHSLEYLTDEKLRRLEDLFEIQWQIDTPFYGLRWSLRPVRALLKGRREPSKFRIYTTRKKK